MSPCVRANTCCTREALLRGRTSTYSGIDRKIAGIIDVRFKVALTSAVERVGKQEATGAAASVIDRGARERQFHAIGDLTVSVEVDQAEKW